ncbi:hypothetical protein ACTWQB_10870 [Piscibacillus sp. B03]
MELQQKHDKYALITQILEVACQLKYDSQYSKEQAVKDLEKVVKNIEEN